ncbi:MAG: tetratricopeptide repeat protein [Armatimonadota bacterium]|nr:tetratricopeptide repeat protein [Armatimonadota bacterium]MDR7533401.1 tetratricopeptide repeat protein [Armatimonadota bacterium]MDR7535231.1 tetratricopeptide repeat protein [Armatimonadota bacterium]
MMHFTTREVAKILDLPASRIRACVRAGLVSPRKGRGRSLEFSFQDLLLLKTTRRLLEARVPLGRIRRLLHSLRRQLPDDRHLTSLTIYADGRRIVAWDGQARWQPDSGQFLFNFDVQDVAEEVAFPVPGPGPGSALGAEEWFNVAIELEGASPEEARLAYRQALELDPGFADAHTNLGRLYHQAGNVAQAEAHYRQAMVHAPDDPIPCFNLGVLLDDLGRREEAARMYRQALARDPQLADAHYNLGLLYEAMGRRADAIAHLRTARALYARPVGARR